MAILQRKYDDETGSLPAEQTVKLPSVGSGTWLSPGTVLEVFADGVALRLPSGERVRARLALALPYEPAIGDELLLLGDGCAAYVTGVLAGRGKTELRLHGDVRIAAEGKLELSAGSAVSLNAPSVEINAQRFTTVASQVTQVFDSLRQTVAKLLSTRAGEQHTLVDGTSQLVAKNARTLSEGKVTINGKEIFLG